MGPKEAHGLFYGMSTKKKMVVTPLFIAEIITYIQARLSYFAISYFISSVCLAGVVLLKGRSAPLFKVSRLQHHPIFLTKEAHVVMLCSIILSDYVRLTPVIKFIKKAGRLSKKFTLMLLVVVPPIFICDGNKTLFYYLLSATVKA